MPAPGATTNGHKYRPPHTQPYDRNNFYNRKGGSGDNNGNGNGNSQAPAGATGNRQANVLHSLNSAFAEDASSSQEKEDPLDFAFTLTGTGSNARPNNRQQFSYGPSPPEARPNRATAQARAPTAPRPGTAAAAPATAPTTAPSSVQGATVQLPLETFLSLAKADPTLLQYLQQPGDQQVSPARNLNLLCNGVLPRQKKPEEVLAPSYKPGSFIMIATEIQGQNVNSLLDYGANFNVLAEQFVERAGLAGQIEPSTLSYATANGQEYHSLGRLRQIPTTIGGNTFLVDYEIAPAHTYDVLLGSDFHFTANAAVDYGRRLLTLTGEAKVESLPLILGQPSRAAAKGQLNCAFMNEATLRRYGSLHHPPLTVRRPKPTPKASPEYPAAGSVAEATSTSRPTRQ